MCDGYKNNKEIIEQEKREREIKEGNEVIRLMIYASLSMALIMLILSLIKGFL